MRLTPIRRLRLRLWGLRLRQTAAHGKRHRPRPGSKSIMRTMTDKAPKIKNPLLRGILRFIVLLALAGLLAGAIYFIGTTIMGYAFRDIINPGRP